MSEIDATPLPALSDLTATARKYLQVMANGEEFRTEIILREREGCEFRAVRAESGKVFARHCLHIEPGEEKNLAKIISRHLLWDAQDLLHDSDKLGRWDDDLRGLAETMWREGELHEESMQSPLTHFLLEKHQKSVTRSRLALSDLDAAAQKYLQVRANGRKFRTEIVSSNRGGFCFSATCIGDGEELVENSLHIDQGEEKSLATIINKHLHSEAQDFLHNHDDWGWWDDGEVGDLQELAESLWREGILNKESMESPLAHFLLEKRRTGEARAT